MKVSNKVIRKPYQQGDLDALCGVYCVINIIHYMTKLNKTQAKMVLIDILKYLEKKRRLRNVMKNGLHFRAMKLLINQFLPGKDIVWSLPYKKADQPSLDEYWSALQKFMQANEACCVLLRLAGRMNHWTILHTISNDRLYLFDSDHLKFIQRKYCNTQYRTVNNKYVIWPSHTVFIIL